MNRQLWWAAVMATSVVTSQAALVGHWGMGEGATFDGSNWTIPDQTASPANASSFNMTPADRVNGAPLGDASPSFGMSFHNAGYCNIGNPAKLNFAAGSSLTVTAWVKPMPGTGATEFRPIVGKGDSQYLLRYNASLNRFEFFTYDGTWHQVNSDGSYEPGFWYFVCGRLDASAASNHVSVWVDGQRFGQANGGVSASTNEVNIGRNSGVSNRLFIGTIDDVRIFNHALSEPEITGLYDEGSFPPVIAQEPHSTVRYAGLTARFTVKVFGTLPIGYQWRKGGVPLSDGGDLSGANSATLTIANLEAGDAGSYDVVATNFLGTATSSAASLTVDFPAQGSYAEAVVNRRPIAYWPFNETSGLVGHDYAGGYDTTHTDFTFHDPGPRPPSFPGMDATNAAVAWDGFDNDGSETAASIMNNRAQFTIMGWLKTEQLPALNANGGNRVALFGQNDVAEFGFHSASELGLWTPGGFVAVDPNNVIKAGEWAFLAATGDGKNMRLYVNGDLVDTFAGDVTTYGSSSDPFRFGFGVLDAAGDNFWGAVDEVAVYDRALSPSDIQDIYGLAAEITFPPEIIEQPTDLVRYAGAPIAAEFSVLTAGSPPLSYSWRNGGELLADGGSVSGSATDQLRIFPVTVSDEGTYDVVINNERGSDKSSLVNLTVIEPLAGSYEESVLALNPAGYWRLNEPAGASVAYDGWMGRNGTYRSAAIQGVEGVTGTGFEPGNTAVRIAANTAEADVSLPSLDFNTNTVTIACWFKADGNQGGFRGLVFLRAGGTVSGLHFGDGNELRYSWNDRDWDFAGGPVAPTNEWVFAALVVQPDRATLHMGVNGVLQSVVNVSAHANSDFRNSPAYIGWDPASVNRHFNGLIDEVMILDRALSVEEVQALYFTAVQPLVVKVRLDASGNLLLTWPAGATLESATDIMGPWTPMNGATSPFPFEPLLPKGYFRIAK